MYSEAVAKGKAGSSPTDTNPKGAAVTVSSGKGSTLTPAAGLGKDKRHINNVEGDNARMKIYKDQIKKDKASDRGINNDDRKERARANKQKRINKEGEAFLNKLRGK
jgi:hypothetical protein